MSGRGGKGAAAGFDIDGSRPDKQTPRRINATRSVLARRRTAKLIFRDKRMRGRGGWGGGQTVKTERFVAPSEEEKFGKSGGDSQLQLELYHQAERRLKFGANLHFWFFSLGLKEFQSLQQNLNVLNRCLQKRNHSLFWLRVVCNSHQWLDGPSDCAAAANYRGKTATLCRLLITSIRLSSAGGVITSVAAVILLIYMDFIM